MTALQVEWHDLGRAPQCPPNPDYPEGIDIDLAAPGRPVCETALPYPAKRCGFYVVTCSLCGLKVGVTTAGRPDDPRSVKVACMTKGTA